MLVLIEVTAAEQMVLWYEKEGAWEKTTPTPILRNATVAAFAGLFKETGCELAALTGLGVHVASERFTTVRLVATIGNTLALALHVPIVTAPPHCALEKLRSLIAEAVPGHYVLPEYQAPPRLGGSQAF